MALKQHRVINCLPESSACQSIVKLDCVKGFVVSLDIKKLIKYYRGKKAVTLNFVKL